jgi:hypothetical protein
MASTDYVLDTASAPAGKNRTVTRQSDEAATQAGNNLEYAELNIPDVVGAGDKFAVYGRVYLDAIVDITEIETRVVITVAGEEKTVDTPKLGAGEGASFRETFTAPEIEGQGFDVEVRADVNPPDYLPGIPSGWQTKEKRTKTVEVGSRGEVATHQLVEYAPYAVGGGGLGYVVAQNTGRAPRTGMLVGAAGGAAVKRYYGGVPRISNFTPNLTTVVAYTALFGAGAFLLNNISETAGGVGEIAGAAGDVVSAPADIARAAGRTAGRVRGSSSR